jgi:type IV pilus assembly protein PilX
MTSHSFHKQHGTVLILSLLLLLVLTMLGLSSIQTTIMEEKMTGNMRDINQSFEATESALREAERWLDKQTSEPSPGSDAFVYQKDTLPDLAIQSHSWWTNSANTGEYANVGTGSSALSEVGSQPRFVLEHRAFIPDSLVRGYEPPKGKNIYQATARGTGGTDTAQSIVQNTFVKRFN